VLEPILSSPIAPAEHMNVILGVTAGRERGAIIEGEKPTRPSRDLLRRSPVKSRSHNRVAGRVEKPVHKGREALLFESQLGAAPRP